MLDLIKIRRDLHQIPEVCYQETQTSAYLSRILSGLTAGKPGVEITPFKTGFLVFVPGKKPAKTIAWRTDIDGLAIPEKTGLPYASRREGFMHACGHDIHQTIALGVLEALLAESRDNNFLVIFQPAEEGGGGGKALYDSGALDRYHIAEIYALHISPEYPPGVIATKPGTLFAACSSVILNLIGKGGHGAMPHECIDPIAAMAAFIMEAQTLVSRNVNPMESAVLTFGTIQGGSQVNSVADSCEVKGTLRTLTTETLELCRRRIDEMARGIALAAGAEAQVQIESGAYLPVKNNPELTARFMAWMKTRMETNRDFTFQECPVTMTSEDFGYLVDKFPGMMFWLGVGGGVPLHSDVLKADEGVIVPAVRLITDYLTSL